MSEGLRSGLSIGLLTGLVTSVAGGFLYAYLIDSGLAGVYFGGALLLIFVVSVICYRFRGKWFLLWKSGIKGYFPKGQSQCVKRIVSELKSSRSVVFIGARGMDLVGENSPFSAGLKRAQGLQLVEVYLLAPGGKNSRLRGQVLDVERSKYQAECEAVDNFLGSLALRDDLPIRKYSYSEKPHVRLVQTEKSIWIAFYRTGLRGRELPIVNVTLNSHIARQVEKYIDSLRATSQLREYRRDAQPRESGQTAGVDQVHPLADDSGT